MTTRKLTNGQKRRMRIQTEKAVQQALLEQEQYVVLRKKYIAQADTRSRHFVASDMPPPVIAATPPLSKGWFVPNWQHGWRWFSNIALTAIVAINTAPIPPEIIQALPPHAQQQVTIGLAVIGILGRFINQSRPRKDNANGA